ncbi:MAG: PA14 domain-containing protein [Thermodesulfobacteriota bacterium]
MKPVILRVSLVALAILFVCVALPSFGEDYLVIKKKDGETQRVPLKFSPDDIESLKVEAGPTRGKAPATPGAEDEPAAREPRKRVEEDKAAPSEPMIPMREPRATTPLVTRPDTESARPREAEPRRPAAPSGPRKSLTRAPAPTPPADATGIGTFTVNVYKLPENVRALPDFSAFRPVEVITADQINLHPGAGGGIPTGLPEDTKGLGMRFIGVFQVSGEGIFQWRVNAKDGVRLHVDDKTIVEIDGVHPAVAKTGYIHLAEGVHVIVLDSFNSSGPPVLQLFVTPPLGSEEVFSIKKGLAGWKEPSKPYDVLWGQVYFVPKGKYPGGPDLSKMSPIGRIIAPELRISDGQTLAGLPGRKDMVAVRYEGYFTVQGAGVFAFRLVADEYASLSIGKDEIVRVVGGTKGSPEGRLGWAFLQEGSYPIAVTYFHSTGEPKLELFVTQPKQQEQVFSPSQPLVGYASDTGKMSQVPCFVYFLKAGTNKIPNFNQMTPSGMFFVDAIDFPIDRGSREFPGVPRREDWLGLRFYVKFSLSDEEKGTYKFRLVAEDGARLIVGKNLVVNAEGFQRRQEKTGTVNLEPGTHEMFVDYYQTTGPNGIQLFITPPGGEEKVFAFQ